MITTGANLPAEAHEPGHIEAALQRIVHAGGRPSIYTPQLAATVIKRLMEGETLTKITKDPAMPGWVTIAEWKKKIPQFANAYARARIDRAPVFAESALDDLEGADTTSMAHVRKAEAIANHKVLLAKYDDRETYGDQKGLGVTCGDINLVFNITPADPPQQAIEVEFTEASK